MLKHGNLFKTLNLWFAWITVCISYYALSLNAADLGGNIILNYVLKSLVGLVSSPILALSMNKLGRKYSLVSSHVFLGTLLLCLAFIPKEYTTGVLIFYLLSSMAIGISMVCHNLRFWKNLIVKFTSKVFRYVTLSLRNYTQPIWGFKQLVCLQQCHEFFVHVLHS